MTILLSIIAVLVGLSGSVFAQNTYSYDPLNRLQTITYGDGRSVGFHYDVQGNLISRTVVSFGADVNTNGIPDAWENQYFGNLTTASSTSDADHDGSPDWQEFWAGTVPTNSMSCLVILPASRPSSEAGQVIRWQGTTGTFYRIERSTDLLAQPAFQTVATDIRGVEAASWTDTTVRTEGVLFYRIVVQP
ncbi:MAG: RHS repeat domain-containing protein [bacterium]